MKTLATAILLILLAHSAQARLLGSSLATVAEKQAQGFEIKTLSHQDQKDLHKVEEFKFLYGRQGSAFNLVLKSRVLLPIDGDESRRGPKLKVAVDAIEFNQEISEEIYSQLNIDFTPKKIGEGITFEDSMIQCPSPQSCQMRDDRGDFYAFTGFSGINGNRPKPFYTYFYDGRNKFQPMNYDGQVKGSDNELTESFKKAVEDFVYEIAPSEFIYRQVESSVPNRDKSIEEHRNEVDKDLSLALGGHTMEKLAIESLLFNVNVDYVEGFKESSGSNCTYFCGATGPFVRGTMSANVLF